MAVVGDVVARHHGERHDAVLAAAQQAGEDETEHGLRTADVCGVGDDRRMRRVEFSGRGIDEIAALGDGQRDDADRRIRQSFDDRLRVAGHQEVGHATGDPGAHMAGILLDHRGQPILFLQLPAACLLAVEHARADDRPIMSEASIEQIVEINGLVRAVKIADAEMHDAGLERRAVVMRAGDIWRQLVEVGEGEFDGHRQVLAVSRFVRPPTPSRLRLATSPPLTGRGRSGRNLGACPLPRAGGEVARRSRDGVACFHHRSGTRAAATFIPQLIHWPPSTL